MTTILALCLRFQWHSRPYNAMCTPFSLLMQFQDAQVTPYISTRKMHKIYKSSNSFGMLYFGRIFTVAYTFSSNGNVYAQYTGAIYIYIYIIYIYIIYIFIYTYIEKWLINRSQVVSFSDLLTRPGFGHRRRLGNFNIRNAHSQADWSPKYNSPKNLDEKKAKKLN